VQAAAQAALELELEGVDVVMCKARLGSNAPAQARLLSARALTYSEPGPQPRPRAG
jgi:hypothetical protein